MPKSVLAGIRDKGLVFGNETCRSAANAHPTQFMNGKMPNGAGNLEKAPRQFWEGGGLSKAEKKEGTSGCRSRIGVRRAGGLREI